MPASSPIDLPTSAAGPPPGITLGDVAPDAICSLGLRPHLITGILVQSMRQHFAAASNIENPALRNLVWDPSPGSSIVVESITRWKPAASGTRPAVVVKRGGVSAISLGINDQLQGYFNDDGREFYVTFLRGTHTLFCIGSEAGEAEYLGAEVYRELVQFGPVIRRSFQLTKFKLAGIDELHKVEEAPGSYAVPVSIAYVFEDCWVLEPNAPRLKRISLQSLVDGMA